MSTTFWPPSTCTPSPPPDNQVKSWRREEYRAGNNPAIPGGVDAINVHRGAAHEENGQADEDGENEHHHREPGDGSEGEGKAFHDDSS